MKKFLSLICAAALTLSCLTVGLPGAAAEGTPAATGTTYYISSKSGKGGNSGLSAAAPLGGLDAVDWKNLQPGDQVLLEKGSVFDGFIHLVDVSGTLEAPIKIGTYGEGARPRINGKGQGIWFQDYGQSLDNSWHKYQGYVSSTILLYDCDFVEISGLEITNEVPGEKDRFQPNEYQGDSVAGSMDRTGVAGAAKNGGTMEHIYLNDLYIHDVDGNIQDKHMDNGGIQLNALKPTDESKTGIARYDDVRITNCTVENVSRAGICVGYTYKWGQFGGAALADSVVQTNGHTRVYMANNFVKDAGNDAIVALYCFRPLIENNVSDGAGADLPNYVGGTQRFCAGIWPWKCKDAIYQYNEVYNTVGQGNGDGQAFDVDWSDGTIYQYNYSHNNGMGAILFCLTEATNGVYRYNLSQDDLGAYMTLQGNPNAKIYNNVFYTGPGKSVRILHASGGKNNGNGWIANNIFYNNGGTIVEENWMGTGGSKTYTNNLFYGFATTPADAKKVVVTEADKVFVDPGKAPAATTGIVAARTAFDGFKLKADAPAINAGVAVPDNGGRDFFGNTLDTTPDIGMYDSRTAVLTLSSATLTVDNANSTITGVVSNATAKMLKDALIMDSGITVAVKNASDVALSDTDAVTMDCKVVITANGSSRTYTLVADTDKSIHASAFEVSGQMIKVPVTALSRTTVQDLLSGVTPAVTATMKVTDSQGAPVAGSTPVAAGMKLIITAQDSTSNQSEFVVSVKNTYNYLTDFVGNQQGNVWFAQRKADSSSQMENITAYYDPWKCWQERADESGSSYWFVGLNNGGAPTKGAMCANRSAAVAMAFRAPVDGVVSLSFPAQAQFRTKVSDTSVFITLNGVQIGESYAVPKNAAQTTAIPARAIEVKKGDYLRIETRGGAESIALTPEITYLESNPPISSADYTVDESGKTITNVAYATLKQDFLSKIAVATNVVVTLVGSGDDNEVANDTVVTTGMRLKVTVNSAAEYYGITVLPRRPIGYSELVRTGWRAFAGTAHPATPPAEGPASNVLDGNAESRWHTAWQGEAHSGDLAYAWIAVDMKESKTVGRLGYRARPAGVNAGNIYDYVIETSTDGTTWTQISSGSWDKATVDGDRSVIHYAVFEPVTTQYIRLRALRSEGNHGCASEIYVYEPTYN